ncbi:ATP-binding protein [Geomonas sp. RF6]|uniref:sensor histidine kinase n=1 Tax=Geomonas sp. RF6 TaxID=2897342 RepID=UPI001E4840CD|nr:ATP-binding protein [Geomonas sp. RF6]UFS68869.1 ATP-binding protein [Geomonas sp. RF6]
MVSLQIPQEETSFIRRYGIGLLAAAGAIGLRVALIPLLGVKPPYITFYLGIVVAAAFGGMGPALLVTFLGVAFGFVILPAESVVVEQEVARLALFVLSGFGIGLIAEGMHRHRRTVQKQKQDLQRSHDELERLVQERTEELRRKELLLAQQSRQAAMGEMINNIAHQWRQPLNALGLTVQSLPMLHDAGELTADALNKSTQKSMEIIKHMSETIDDFRNYLKPDKEKVKFRTSDVISRVMKLTEDYFKSFNIVIEVQVRVDPVIVGYPNQFGQVLLNILLNARDAFVERVATSGKIIITTDTENGRGVITISDNAGGIPEKILNKIFEPYFTTKGPERGTGIGLFICKSIVENDMGGKLLVRNIPGGAEFRIECEMTSTSAV